ncbi:HNH endonuclease [Nocardia africana]|uniref:HNH endonuclease n=1 Tax=Nocardia africana TaxID=134964 RepID=UPI000A05D986|nr:HNH endonuclease [Nocardia africana]
MSCEACGFDFELAYPGVGNGYIHVHHAVPLHTTGRIETTLVDLVLLCANCRQMIHRLARWLTCPSGIGARSLDSCHPGTGSLPLAWRAMLSLA